MAGPVPSFNTFLYQAKDVAGMTVYVDVRLIDATNNILTNPDKSASVYDIGIDWGQPFHFRQWSSGYIALRHVFLK